MKICLIGNSHLAALKLGWGHVSAEFPNVELTFFGARGGKMSALRIQGDRLVPKTPILAAQLTFVSGGLKAIVPKDYDVIVLSGLALSVPRVPVGTSAALRRQACVDYVNNSLMPIMLRKLRKITDKTLWVAPAPLTADIDEPVQYPMLPYSVLLNDMQDALQDPNARILGQPEETITSNLTSQSAFSEGSLRLSVSNGKPSAELHQEKDLKHMNDIFGASWLRFNLPKLLAV